MKSRKLFIYKALGLCCLSLVVVISCVHEGVKIEPPRPVTDLSEMALHERVARLERALTRREEQLSQLRLELEKVTGERDEYAAQLERAEEQLEGLKQENEVLKKKIDEILAPKSESPPAKQDIYVVQPGDTLESIAGKEEIYGDRTRWEDIYEENRDVIGEDPANLVPETKLIIPRP